MNSAPFIWLPFDFVHDLGWTLIHFLWQGALLTLVLELALLVSRDARTRYNIAFATLLGMVAAPVATFLTVRASPIQVEPLAALPLSSPTLTIASIGGDGVVFASATLWLSWLVLAWFLGVAALSLRVAGGWYAAQRLIRRNTTSLPAPLRARCEQLVRRVGVSRPVRFLQSAAIQVPAVVGWLRPVVLVPVSLVTGLTPHQLEAPILHELAHIRRLDVFANLIQIAVETVLFYHPAVWWVSRRIRMERENCCDDLAVSLSGDALGYARALTALEESRALPVSALAANGGALKQRIARILGLHVKPGNASATVAAAIVVLCLVGGVAARGASNTADTAAAPVTGTATTTIATELPSAAPTSSPTVLIPPVVPKPPVVAVAPLKPARPDAPVPPRFSSEDIAGAAGDLAASAVALADAVTKEVLPAVEAGLLNQESRATDQATRDAMAQARAAIQAARDESRAAIEQARAAQLRARGAASFESGADEFVALGVQGVTPEYMRAVQAAWPDASTGEILAMRAVGVDPAEVADFKRAGITDLSPRDSLAFKTLGVTPEYIRVLQAAGLKDLRPQDYITAKARGITPEFIAAVHSHGFTNLSMRQLLALRDANVF